MKEKLEKFVEIIVCRAEQPDFSPGDQVLVWLPVTGPHFKLNLKFSGPYTVTQKVSDQNHLIATPSWKRSTKLCHINMLKPCYVRVFEVGPNGEEEVGNVHPVLSASCSVGAHVQYMLDNDIAVPSAGEET